VSAPGWREGRSPALVSEARELEVESLTGHAGGDEADARPAIEPLLAVAQRGCRVGGWRQPGGGQGRDQEPAAPGEIERGAVVHRVPVTS
jgi:hypothetical protein